MGQADDASWLQRHRERWRASGQPWQGYLKTWAAREGLHTGASILAALAQRLVVQRVSYGPYFYSDLAEVSRDTETAAIAAGALQATGIHLTATKR